MKQVCEVCGTGFDPDLQTVACPHEATDSAAGTDRADFGKGGND